MKSNNTNNERSKFFWYQNHNIYGWETIKEKLSREFFRHLRYFDFHCYHFHSLLCHHRAVHELVALELQHSEVHNKRTNEHKRTSQWNDFIARITKNKEKERNTYKTREVKVNTECFEFLSFFSFLFEKSLYIFVIFFFTFFLKYFQMKKSQSEYE